MGWTDERVELLKKLWQDGLSASQIAGELGGITRNAVIGKVHRLGLSGRAKSPSSTAPRTRRPRVPQHGTRPFASGEQHIQRCDPGACLCSQLRLTLDMYGPWVPRRTQENIRQPTVVLTLSL